MKWGRVSNTWELIAKFMNLEDNSNTGKLIYIEK